MKKSYTYYQDSGHGWIKVSIVELIELNLLTKISSYSYMKNQYAYLEEDNDCDIFIKAKNELLKAGEKLKFNSKFSARANIRNYEYFDPSKAMDNLKARQIVLLRKKFFARVNDLSNKLAYQYNVGNNTKNFDPVKLSRLLHQHTRIENIYLNNKWG